MHPSYILTVYNVRSMWVINERFDKDVSFNPVMREKEQFARIARQAGFQVFDITAHWAKYSDARTALSSLPAPREPQLGIINGFIHHQEDYEELYEACSERNVHLMNRPEDYARAHSLLEAYPRLGDLTPKTCFVEDPEALKKTLLELGLPVFIKGAIQSLKLRGWNACVARTVNEAQEIAEALWSDYDLSAGVIAVRKLVKLRHERTKPDGFPVGREFRVFLCAHRPLAFGYYWKGQDAQSRLSEEERGAVLTLAQDASKRLEVPYLTVDIGQLESGEWIVIEAGDPQSSGFGQVDIQEVVDALASVSHVQAGGGTGVDGLAKVRPARGSDQAPE